jgi:phosphate starvation-inducible PhoH-like protein
LFALNVEKFGRFLFYTLGACMARKTKNKKDANDFSYPAKDSATKLVIAVTAKNAGQKKALKAISENKVTFVYGASGSGKTHCAVGWGIQELIKGTYDRVIFTRPYVEAGEKLGFLPGGSSDKFAPFTMPLYEVVSDYLSNDDMKELMDEKKIIVYPIAYMRGITFRKSYVIADEVQNMSPQQMRMLLTRIGEGSKIVCTGDVEQSDIGTKLNGLADALNRLQDIQDLVFVELDYSSCVRDKIVADIDQRYKDNVYAVKSAKKIDIKDAKDLKTDDGNFRG